jgi:hypothetical protein
MHFSLSAASNCAESTFAQPVSTLIDAKAATASVLTPAPWLALSLSWQVYTMHGRAGNRAFPACYCHICPLPWLAKGIGFQSRRAKMMRVDAIGGISHAMRGYAYLTSVGVSLAAAFGALAPAAAEDASYCVTCTGPNQTYVCHVTGEGAGRTDALKLYCIVRTAKEGGHASCAARNEVSSCQGVTKVYAYDGPSLPANVGHSSAVEAEAGIDEAFDAEPKNEAPKTLVEATGRAYSASRRGIRNVRARFGGGSDEAEAAQPSAGAADSLPSSAAAHGSLPELPGASPSPLTPLPSSMTPKATTEAALVPHASGGKPAEEKGRIRRGAESVGKFAKKSYRCVRSLFFNCRSKPQTLGLN